MEALGAAAGIIAVTVAWLDLRKKMNGHGSIAQKEDLARVEEKIDDLAAWQQDHVKRWHNYN